MHYLSTICFVTVTCRTLLLQQHLLIGHLIVLRRCCDNVVVLINYAVAHWVSTEMGDWTQTGHPCVWRCSEACRQACSV